jgi:hypothetical protein
LKEQQNLKEKSSGRIFRKSIELKIMKQIIDISIRLNKMRGWTLWMGQPLQKRKKRLHTEQEPEM